MTAKDLQNQQQVAIKFERTPVAAGTGNDFEFSDEYEYYRRLKHLDFIPALHRCEEGNNGMRILVFELVGPSLTDLVGFLARVSGTAHPERLSMKTVCILADQMIKKLRTIHRRRVVHRDIKPGNIAIGLGKAQNKFYLLDFGAAVPLDDRTKRHLDPAGDLKLTTWKYASASAHEGFG